MEPPRKDSNLSSMLVSELEHTQLEFRVRISEKKKEWKAIGGFNDPWIHDDPWNTYVSRMNFQQRATQPMLICRGSTESLTEDVLYIWTTTDAILELISFSWVSLIALDGAIADIGVFFLRGNMSCKLWFPDSKRMQKVNLTELTKSPWMALLVKASYFDRFLSRFKGLQISLSPRRWSLEIDEGRLNNFKSYCNIYIYHIYIILYN